MAIRYAADKNILLRLSHRNDPAHSLISESVRRLISRNVELCFTRQSFGEFWNVGSRPSERDGFGLSVQETERRFQDLIRTMKLLPALEQESEVWFRLLLIYEVRGVQVHDAHLVATLEVHGVAHLLTLNGPDFKRFPNLIPVHPRDILP